MIRVNMGVGTAGIPILRERRGWIMATRQGTIDGHGCAGVDVRSRCWWRGEQVPPEDVPCESCGEGVSELKSLLVMICAHGRHSRRHPPAAALRLGQHDEEGWLA